MEIYTDPQVVPHALVRTPDGHITPFNAPGDGEGAGLNQGTVAYAINDFGVIAGQFQDSKVPLSRFRARAGREYHAIRSYGRGHRCGPGHPRLGSQYGRSNRRSLHIDDGNTEHGFFRSRDGVVSSIDPTESVGTIVCEETCLNRPGEITGFYIDSSDAYHGFLRDPDGTITTIDAPERGTGAFQGTFAGSINDEGTITGYLVDSNNIYHGFLRTREGKFTRFHDSDGGTAAGQGTAAFSINPFGAVTGALIDTNNVLHGYSRSRHGVFTMIDAKGAGTSAGQGTRPSTNNLEGDVAGWWIDEKAVSTGRCNTI